MSNQPWVRTGRADTRRRCLSCDQRVRIGEPQPLSSWPERLHLTKEQCELLLVAAAEFTELSHAAGEPDSAVPFVDWMAVDAMGLARVRVEWDGAQPRYENGSIGRRNDSQGPHRHPDPIPFAALPRTWQR